MTALIDKLKEICDLIIIDGTPSKLVTDAIILSRIVDSTIIVTGHNMTKKEDLTKVVRDIKNVGGKIAGVVYNKKPVSNKKKNETYYYASTPMKIDSRKKQQEMEYRQKRQVQVNRATDMLNRDRNPEEYQKNDNDIEESIQHEDNLKEQSAKITNEMPPEERAVEMVRQFNDYLKKEKENRDNNRS